MEMNMQLLKQGNSFAVNSLDIRMLRFSILAALAAVLCSASSLEAEGTLAKRAPTYVVVSHFNGADCNNIIDEGHFINPGECYTLPNSAKSAQVYNDRADQNCILKYWSEKGCTGAAVTWFVPSRTKNNKCFKSAYRDGGLVLTGGAQSVLLNCADQYVPS
ncbi:hypothetical protein GQ53DRAFT_829105 [Thozetella sp. PMI_491]|nr:hypothetical protein GQ53DRAFT_829105 [Thozetella sp. PMI_491]